MAQSRDELKTIPSKDNIYHPSSIEEIQQIINYAQKEKIAVRTIGSGHSPSASIFPEDKHIKVKLAGDFTKIEDYEICLMSKDVEDSDKNIKKNKLYLKPMNGTLEYAVLGVDNKAVHRSFITADQLEIAITGDSEEEKQAFIKKCKEIAVFDTLLKITSNKGHTQRKSFLIDDAKDSALVTVGAGCYLGINPSDEASTLENSFNYQIDQRGFALPTLGGISHQTIAGFLSTSSSGGTAKHNIADAIEAIGFVDGTGHYHQVKKGEELFNAVGVSMGLLGIITDVTFRLQKRYLVQGSEVVQDVEAKDSCLAGDSKSDYSALDKELFEDSEYGHINWFAQKYVSRFTLWAGKQNYDFSTPEIEYKHALSSKGKALLASGDLLAINVLNESKLGDLDSTQHVIGGLLKPFVDPRDNQEFREIWYKALPIDDQANVDGLFNTSFSEIWFPRSQLNEVMRKAKYIFETNPKAAGNFIVELYAAKESPFYLSPSQGHDALRVDLYWWVKNPCGDANKYFGQFYEAFKDIPGIRYHWGKHLPHPGEKYGEYVFNSEDLQKNYPKLPDFLKLREKCDPHQLFVTDYWRKYLSIPAPKPAPSWLWDKTIGYISGLNLFPAKASESKEPKEVKEAASALVISRK